MSSTATLPLPTVSPEVRAFASSRGVESYLTLLVAAARRIFPEARIEIDVEEDPEISGNRQIVFEVEENGRNAAEQVAAHNMWTEELIHSCPATHLHVFCLLQGRIT